jgi:hypothetical protein
MLPVDVQLPGVRACAVVVGVPVTDLLNPPKARSRPIEQRTKPIKTRKRRRIATPIGVPNDFPARLIISLREGEFDGFHLILIVNTKVMRT